MSRFFKSAAFPIIIVIVLAFFASKLIADKDRAEPTNFSQFLTQIATPNGQVKSATLKTKDNSRRGHAQGRQEVRGRLPARRTRPP